MEELREKAGSYAEENVINVLKEVFAKVYADGYRDGYKDRADEIPVDLRLDQTKFVDLGLPSGTLWSENYEMQEDKISYLPYDDASNYEIPSKEQMQELIDNCQWEFHYIDSVSRKYICIGPNGNHIVFYSKGYKLADTQREHEKIYFWIMSNNDASSKNAAYLYYHKVPIKEVRELFSGNKLPLRLVKKK